MTTYRAAIVQTSIDAPPESVVSFLSDLQNWKTWAPWIESVARKSQRDWTLETEAGVMNVRFVEPNSLGVLDHQVTLASGTTITNSLRVIANGSGSELVMVLLQWPHMSAPDFDRDVLSVTDDFARLKAAVERAT